MHLGGRYTCSLSSGSATVVIRTQVEDNHDPCLLDLQLYVFRREIDMLTVVRWICQCSYMYLGGRKTCSLSSGYATVVICTQVEERHAPCRLDLALQLYILRWEIDMLHVVWICHCSYMYLDEIQTCSLPSGSATAVRYTEPEDRHAHCLLNLPLQLYVVRWKIDMSPISWFYHCSQMYLGGIYTCSISPGSATGKQTCFPLTFKFSTL